MSAAADNILVRPGRLEDLPAVSRIEHSSFDDPWSDEALGGELLADSLRLSLVAEIEDVVVGYLMAWKIVDQLHVLNVAVDSSRLRSGIATALLLRAGQLAASLAMRELTLEVRRGNDPAIEFYLRHGFVEVGVREGYYAESGEDALIMNCPVNHLMGQ